MHESPMIYLTMFSKLKQWTIDYKKYLLVMGILCMEHNKQWEMNDVWHHFISHKYA